MMFLIFALIIMPEISLGFSFSELIKCPQTNGLFAHPRNCKWFINCWQNRPYVQHCNRNLYFNPQTKRCDYRYNVICKDDELNGWKFACGHNRPLIVTSPSQIIENYPSNEVYKPNLNCSWLIKASYLQTIKLKVLWLNLENSKDCIKDKIDIYDGKLLNERKIHTFCGKSENILQVTSVTNKLYINFVTDFETEFEGFQLVIEFIPAGKGTKVDKVVDNKLACNSVLRFNNTDGVIISPGYDEKNAIATYPSNSRCKWRIIAPEDHFIRFHFSFMDIEKSHGCGLDALVIFGNCHDDDKLESCNILANYCGNILPDDFKTLSNDVILFFASDAVRNFRGFRLEYEILPESRRCGSNQLMCSNKECVSNSDRCNGFDNCAQGIDEVNCIITKTNVKQCGIPAIQPLPSNSRIIGGRVAKHGSWPWQGALFFVSVDLIFKCGAIVIHSEWMLTAAHCLKGSSNPSRWAIQVGKQDLSAEEESALVRSVDKIILHPEYDGDKPSPSRSENDIALLHLRRPLEFTDYIIPICLPKPYELIEIGTKIHVTGFGKTEGIDFRPSDVLKQVELPIASKQICNDIYKTNVSDLIFCAGLLQGGQDSCQGDSGGPAVAYFSGQWKLLGIVSGGDGCAVKNKLGVYTKVSQFVPWIEKTTEIKFDF